MNEDMAVFKSYLRKLLRDLKDLKQAMEENPDQAHALIDRLIDDTQKDIEDN